MTATLLDTIVMVVIFLSVLIAFFRGFVKEMITIISIGGAVYIAYAFGQHMTPSFNEWLGVTKEASKRADYIFGMVPPEKMAVFLSYLSVFLCVFIILSLAGMAVSASIAALGLGPLDKILGMGFGAVRGFLIVFLMYVPFGMIQKEKSYEEIEWLTKSFSYEFLDAAFKWADETLNPKESEKEGEKEEIDPNSIKGKMIKKFEETTETVLKMQAEKTAPAEDAQEDTKDMLTDDEATTNQ